MQYCRAALAFTNHDVMNPFFRPSVVIPADFQNPIVLIQQVEVSYDLRGRSMEV